MVVTNDIATLNDIHPPNKQDVGSRLAGLALRYDYGNDLVANSPEMESMKIDGDTVTIRFKNTGGGLQTSDAKEASHFELIGNKADGFKPATATIDGDTVKLKSDEVPSPVAFRFGWHKLAEPNLAGATGLPVGSFRGGADPSQ